nr:hypothetical protein CFP56_74804 [Quercus suber]
MASTEEASNNKSSFAVNEDFVNPFFLSSSDNNTIQLVSKRLIGGKNYFPWVRSIIISLTAKHKIGFIDGTFLVLDPDSPQFILWTRCNMIVLSWIINSVSPRIGSSIMYTDNARAIWLDLRHRFFQKSGPRIFELQNESAYLCKANFLWRNTIPNSRLWLMSWPITNQFLTTSVLALMELKKPLQILVIVIK